MVHTVLYAVCCSSYTMSRSCSICLCLYFSTYNWVLGNSNPMDYIPPSFCDKAKLEETDTPDNVFTILESLAKKTKKVE